MQTKGSDADSIAVLRSGALLFVESEVINSLSIATLPSLYRDMSAIQYSR